MTLYVCMYVCMYVLVEVSNVSSLCFKSNISGRLKDGFILLNLLHSLLIRCSWFFGAVTLAAAAAFAVYGSGEGVPTLQADQLNIIAHHLNEINTNVDLWPNKKDWPQLLDSPEIIPTQLKVNKLRRKLLKETDEWASFLKSEWKQLNQYKDAGMFGKSVLAKHWMMVLPWVWTYLQKENPLTGIDAPKARDAYNGGPQHGEAVTLAETYAVCVEQPIH